MVVCEPSPDWELSLVLSFAFFSDRRVFLEGFHGLLFWCFSWQDVRHHFRRFAQRRCLDVSVIGAHSWAVMADEFLDNGGTDARIFHKACGGVTQCMESDF